MITAIVDLQFGSTGKGLIAGYLSQKNEYDVVVSANMPNAGHTFVDEEGRKWINKVLPSGVYSKKLQYICIGPGAVFDIEQLRKEMKQLDDQIAAVGAIVVIHPDAGVLLAHHKEREQETLRSISSTMQGSMEAMYEKMQRQPESNTASNWRKAINDAGAVVISHAGWNRIMGLASNILMEGSQGYSLGINAGFYPYCTSRDCTVWRLIADCGVIMNAHKLHVIGTARVHPIRVGSLAGHTSGPGYDDQRELTWEEVGQTPETTTVTGRIRRVFSFSEEQIKEAMYANRVDEVFLNFANYDYAEAIKTKNKINTIAHKMFQERGEWTFGDRRNIVAYMGFGPGAECVLETKEWEGDHD